MSDGMTLKRDIESAVRSEGRADAFLEAEALRVRIKELEATVRRLERELLWMMSLDSEHNSRCISIKTIAELVEAKTGYSLFEMRTDQRKRPLSYARHLFWYLVSTHTKISLPAMGRFLEKDHTSAIHGIRRVKQRMETDQSLKELVLELSMEIKAISAA